MEDKKISDLNRVADTGGAELFEVVKGSANFRRKMNLTATAAPTVGDDSTEGYSVGSPWVYDGDLWVCKNSTAGAAVWRRVTPIDGEWTPSISASNGATVDVTAALYQYAGGDICHFSMAFDVQMDASDTTTQITVSDLPVPTTFTSGRQVIAAVNIGEDNIGEYASCVVSGSGTTIIIDVGSVINGASLQGLAVVGHYLVL